MLQKLFSLVDQTSVPDNPDSLQNQEVLLPGHLITIYLKVKLCLFIPMKVFSPSLDKINFYVVGICMISSTVLKSYFLRNSLHTTDHIGPHVTVLTV